MGAELSCEEKRQILRDASIHVEARANGGDTPRYYAVVEQYCDLFEATSKSYLGPHDSEEFAWDMAWAQYEKGVRGGSMEEANER